MRQKPTIKYWVCNECAPQLNKPPCLIKKVNKTYWHDQNDGSGWLKNKKRDICDEVFTTKELTEGEFMLELL